LAMVAVLRTCPPLDAVVDGVPRRLALLFVGNGSYGPRGFVPRWRPALDSGRLDVRFADTSRRFSWLGLVLASVTGDLYRTSSYVEASPEVLDVKTNDSTKLSRDGEVSDAPSAVNFSVRRQALTVYCGAASRER
jgi:diacylglycerol kinase family enzyme